MMCVIRTWLSVRAVLGYLLLPCAAAAQENVATTPRTTEMGVVDAVAALHDAERDEVVSRVVMDKEALLRFGDDRVIDALRRMPGVTVREGRSGQRGGVSLRGLAGGYAQILVDGQRAPPGFDLESLASVMIERIEILPSAVAESSTEGIAGTINIIMASGYRREGGEASVALGSSRGSRLPAASLTRTVQAGRRKSTLDVAVSRREYATYEHEFEQVWSADDDVVAERNGARRSTGFRQVGSIAPRVEFELPRGGSLALRSYLEASDAHRRTEVAWQSSALAGAGRRDYSNDIEVAQLQNSLDWVHVLPSTARLSTRLSLGGNREHASYVERASGPAGEPIAEELTRARLAVSGWSASGKYAHQPVGEHSVQLGWSTQQDRWNERRARTFARDGMAGRDDQAFHAEVGKHALYGQDEWRVSAAFSAYLGFRWERVVTSSRSEVGTIRNQADVYSPILQGLWKFQGGKGRQLRLSLSRTYRAPELRQLIARRYTSLDNGLLQPDLQGNPGLRPELANGVDVSLEQPLAKDAQVTMGAYLRDVRHVIVNDIQFSQGRWTSLPVNAGRAHSWGSELAVNASLRQFFRSAPDVRMSASVGWNNSRVRDVPGPDNRLARQLPWQARFSADYGLSRHWKVGGSLGLEAARTTRVSASEWEREAGSRELDLYALWTPRPGGQRVRVSASRLFMPDPHSERRFLQGERGASASTIGRNDAQVRIRWEVPLH